ncbi:MAG: phosphoglycerate dehydrogenase [Alphaproteobacteria bacterium]
MPKVLISDSLSTQAVETFKRLGVEPTVVSKLTVEELEDMIVDFDGLAVRSATKVTPSLLAKAKKLKVVGRAGIGIDNIDLDASTSAGVLVMNTPFGNAMTTAEHAIAMMFALARHIPQASASTHAGKWEKSKFLGTELNGKTLGLIGAGNIGSIVAKKALGLGLKVSAYDPFLTAERAKELHIKKVELDDLLSSADIITLHVPKTPDTSNIINATAINKMKKGAMIINCARGGLVDEVALKAALDSGYLAGAALDVFEVEPAKDNPLFGMEQVICTPHLGASTTEAQEKVAIQIAEQMSDFLIEGAITNALNAPSLSAAEAAQLGPHLRLAENLGEFAGQLTNDEIKEIEISFEGEARELNTDPLQQTILAALLRRQLTAVNRVNALAMAADRGIKVSVTKTVGSKDYSSQIGVRVVTTAKDRHVKGTLFGDHPRLTDVKGIKLESEFSNHMLYIANEDVPGVVGAMGNALAANQINIAQFHLGRQDQGGDAVALVSIDAAPSAAAIAAIESLPQIRHATYLQFV